MFKPIPVKVRSGEVAETCPAEPLLSTPTRGQLLDAYNELEYEGIPNG